MSDNPERMHPAMVLDRINAISEDIGRALVARDTAAAAAAAPFDEKIAELIKVRDALGNGLVGAAGAPTIDVAAPPPASAPPKPPRRPEATRSQQAEILLSLFPDMETVRTAAELAKLARSRNINEASTYAVASKLVQQGFLERPGPGLYKLAKPRR